MTARPSLPLQSSAVTHRAPGSSGAGMATPLKRWARKGGITMAGVGLLAGGAVMLVLPGPGLAVILLGLAVLATEYSWAAHLLAVLRQYSSRVTGPVAARIRRRRQATVTG